MDNDRIAQLERRHTSCSDVEELLDDYLEGELDDTLKLRVDNHLGDCSRCSDLMFDCRRIIHIASTLNDVPLQRAVRLRLRETLQREMGHLFSPVRPSLHLVK